MTYEDKKKHLEKFIALDAQIDALIKEKEKWYNRILSIKTTDEESKETVHNIIKRVELLEKEIDTDIDSLVDMREEIIAVIERVEDFNCKQILHLKYINGMSFERIGETLGYCTKQISRLHKKAINLINL